jgi:hypothetical protein
VSHEWTDRLCSNKLIICMWMTKCAWSSTCVYIPRRQRRQFQPRKSREQPLAAQSILHCNKVQFLCTSRGAITQPLWHVRFPRGDLEDAFGSSATTAGLLPKCRYVLPPESHFLRFSRWNVKRGKIQSGKNSRHAKKTFNDASGGFSGPIRRINCDAMHQ